MAGNLTDPMENAVLDWVNVVGTPTRPTSPLKARLMTANGSDSSAGTEVTGGGYAAQTVTFGSASGGSASNSGTITFTNMPATTVVGVEIWDSAGSPVRLYYGPLTASKTTNAGDPLSFAVGALAVSAD